ncbi:MAG TPA: FAD-dependent oxidoreductase [Candidatus Acidoferrales bacterium]|nr:FAD-dependent oxidoreductase [Candidatus Acidoferrales bacterium]
MSEPQEELTAAADAVSPQPAPSSTPDVELRLDLAFPRLSEEMLERLGSYGQEETVPKDTCLYMYGDRDTDMFVVLTGEIESRVPVKGGGSKRFRSLRAGEFTGELNVLNTQRSVAEARTASTSRLLRVSRMNLRTLMRAEGDLANIIVSACIWRRIAMISDPSTGVVLRGCEGSPDLLNLRRFLVRNYYPHRIEALPTNDEPDKGSAATNMPEVELLDGRVLVRPAICNLADELGITELPEPHTIYDVAVVGAGPAGLAAAVYAASEGLSTIVIEGIAPGGQAGTSSKIENYLGFPTGVSGTQLASRGHLQALKFGVHFAISRDVVSATQEDHMHRLTLSGGVGVCARSVVIASGARYRRLDIKNHADFENRGLYYAATAMESLQCRDREVIVVGGGNSAGQASVFLSEVAKHVHHIIRGAFLESTMSQYLISRIERSPQITLYTDTEIVELEGESALEFVTWTNRKTGESMRKQISSVFVMIGAQPNSGWLYGTVKLDSKGFVLTGGSNGFEVTPYATSVAGIYAVGDVRAASVKRVASAVGEGSVVVSDIHRYLAQNRVEFPERTKVK